MFPLWNLPGEKAQQLLCTSSSGGNDIAVVGKNLETKTAPGQECRPKRIRNIFWGDGVYFTYEYQDIKIGVCRAMLRTLLICIVFLLYFLLWGLSDVLILIIVGSSCGASCLGVPFLAPSCLAGFLVILLRGIRIGSSIAHVDVQWKF